VDRQTAWNETLVAAPGARDLAIAPHLIEGRIPDALRGGRYLQNGPGWTRIGGRIAHPFDGHGYIRDFRFTHEGGVAFKSRFVQTPAYLAEEKAQRLVYRGLGTNPSPWFWQNLQAPKLRHVANTTIVPWAGKLLAGWEGGAPYALNPETLETRGEEHFGGAVDSAPFLAHMRTDTAQNRLVGVNLHMGMPSRLVFREIDAEGNAVASKEVSIPGLLFVHDFVVTPRWYIFAGNPLRPRMWNFLRAALGAGTLIDAIDADMRKDGVLYLVPRGREGGVRTLRLPSSAFVVHFSNAWDEGESVHIDACAFGTFHFGGEFGYRGQTRPLDPTLPDGRTPQRFLRFSAGANDSLASMRQLSPYGIDFPRVHPDREGLATPASYVCTRADTRKSDPFDSIARVDSVDPDRPTEVWSVEGDRFVGEPVFAPTAGAAHDDEGHVLAVVYDAAAERSTLCVWPSDAISHTPVAQVPLPLLPYAFHGHYLAPTL